MASRSPPLYSSGPWPGRAPRSSPPCCRAPGRNGPPLPGDIVPDPPARVSNGPGRGAESGFVGFKGCKIVPPK